jgi:hypothetical protein
MRAPLVTGGDPGSHYSLLVNFPKYFVASSFAVAYVYLDTRASRSVAASRLSQNFLRSFACVFFALGKAGFVLPS